MEYRNNPQASLAERYVNETGVSIFLTGKAGTGKTTFLKHIVETCGKRNVVLAPTGVAAVNAGGVTLHSFFQLPFCPYLPDVKELVTEYQMPDHQKQLRKSKADIIRTLDLLIIDEISMVRADLLDAIDYTLRRYRRNSKPFGGVQLLMIGDVQQLAPVVSEEERPYMERVYPSPFFFHSKALQRLNYITIQLTTIYRQQDSDFVRLLNNVRDGILDRDTLSALNARVNQNPPSRDGQRPILLCTHNYQADRVNSARLNALPSEPKEFEADIEGNFPESSYPTDMKLTLKQGAQVMFLKNDSSGAHRYYNGKLATVDGWEEIADNDGNHRLVITVVDEQGERINVGREQWENIRYEIDPRDNQIKQIVDGTFTQYPLKTAWAITIHKAQGLTFDRVEIDAAEAFAYGQVYVALSRCRTLEGLTLKTPISPRSAYSSSDIQQFNDTLTPPLQAERQLDAFRTQYYYQVLFELFDFSPIEHDISALLRFFQGDLRTTYPKFAQDLATLLIAIESDIINVAERFHRQLMGISQMPVEQARQLTEDRIAKAVGYFSDKLAEAGSRLAPMLGIEIDNKEVRKNYKEAADQFSQSFGIKQACLNQVKRDGFSVSSYINTKVNFVLQDSNKSEKKSRQERRIAIMDTYADNRNPKLIPILSHWRKMLAEENGLPAYTILTQKSLLAIADKLPRDRASLLKIPGIGKAKVQQYGSEILQIVEDYIIDNGIDVPAPSRQETPDTTARPSRMAQWQEAARLYFEGKSIEDIAGAMLRSVGTVEGYLITAVEEGALDPDIILSQDEQDLLVSYILDNRITALKPIYEHFNGDFSYFKIRIAARIAHSLE